MYILTRLPIFTDYKSNSYDSLFNIVDWLKKKVYCKLVKGTIDPLNLTKVIIHIVI